MSAAMYERDTSLRRKAAAEDAMRAPTQRRDCRAKMGARLFDRGLGARLNIVAPKQIMVAEVQPSVGHDRIDPGFFHLIEALWLVGG